MPKAILMDEFHVTFSAPRGLTEREYDAIYRTLHLQRFRRQLRQAVKGVAGRHRPLGTARIAISR